MKRAGVALILVLAFAGLSNSAYLAQQESNGESIICNIQNFSGCNIVTSSEYSKLFDIPLAQYGVLFYGILFVLAALELVIFDRLLRRVLQVVASVGVAFSLYFIFVQIFFIGAFCIYCLTSAFITFLILILSSLIEPIRVKRNIHPPIRHIQMPPPIS